MAPAELNSGNPHRNLVRNMRKKVKDIVDLKAKDAESLDDAQQKKIKLEKKTGQELAEAQKKYDLWEAENAAASAPAPAPAPAAGKKEKAKEVAKAPAPAAKAPQAEKQKAEKKKAKEDKKWEKVDSPKAKSPAAAPAKAAPAAADAAALMDPKDEKTARNRIKNLKTKLDKVAELKKKDIGELGDDQKAQVKQEKKHRDEYNSLVGKLQAFGLSA